MIVIMMMMIVIMMMMIVIMMMMMMIVIMMMMMMMMTMMMGRRTILTNTEQSNECESQSKRNFTPLKVVECLWFCAIFNVSRSDSAQWMYSIVCYRI